MRPLGVTLVSALYWIRGIVWAFLGTGLFLFSKLIGGMLTNLPPWLGTVWHVMGIGFALLLIAFALLDFAVGSGLLALKRWAMNLAIALSAVHLLLGVGSLFGHPLGVFAVLSALVYGATVVYLLLPPVRALFR